MAVTAPGEFLWYLLCVFLTQSSQAEGTKLVWKRIANRKAAFCALIVSFLAPGILFAASGARLEANETRSSSKMYILGENNIPISCDDYQKFAEALFTRNRQILLSDFSGYTISTVFIGYNPHPAYAGEPQLFETAVFQKDKGKFILIIRGSTWATARENHVMAINLIQKMLMETQSQ